MDKPYGFTMPWCTIKDSVLRGLEHINWEKDIHEAELLVPNRIPTDYIDFQITVEEMIWTGYMMLVLTMMAVYIYLMAVI